MSDIAIKVEDVGKLYRLGEIGTGTISHDLNRWWARIRGKEDPFAKVGEINNRTAIGSSDYVWSLKDINFEVKKGEVLGIIGRNGAGKSTLLKILSKVTSPTTGSIKVNGRIASLLEVGTGFHPELTGRENVFLNGAILGMTKVEIKRKFDEIVDFAGVQRYIDTPVKRYSSGMYVRLAFAVAAHLECEIMIVDEVLAVGDMEFQKKCLEKMEDVSTNNGRTVLYVSHILSSVRELCTNAMLLQEGSVNAIGKVDQVLSIYQSSLRSSQAWHWEGNIGDDEIRVLETKIINNGVGDELFIQDGLQIETTLLLNKDFAGDQIMIGLFFINQWQAPFMNLHVADYNESHFFAKGIHRITYEIPPGFLATGFYEIRFNIGIVNLKKVSSDLCSLSFEVVSRNNVGDAYQVTNSIYFNSQVRPNLPLSIVKIK
jgi:lipopolysaccharide transport system ATP-binding protein